LRFCHLATSSNLISESYSCKTNAVYKIVQRCLFSVRAQYSACWIATGFWQHRYVRNSVLLGLVSLAFQPHVMFWTLWTWSVADSNHILKGDIQGYVATFSDFQKFVFLTSLMKSFSFGNVCNQHDVLFTTNFYFRFVCFQKLENNSFFIKKYSPMQWLH